MTTTPMNETELLASLRILSCVAKADGATSSDELKRLESCLEGAPLPTGITIPSILAETPDLEKQLALLTSPECREQTFQAAFAVAHVDGQCSTGEQKILDRMCANWNLPKEDPALLGRLVREVKDTVLPSNIQAVPDAGKRKAEIQSDTLKYSILSGVLGAFPVPGLSLATDMAVVGIQVKLVRDIGQRWGHTVDQKAANSILTGLGLGTGARIAVNTLLKFVPVAGVVWGASTSFASTWALGEVANQYFEAGAKTDISTYREAFRKASGEGQAAYKTHQAAVATANTQHAAALKALGEELKLGTLSPENYGKKVSELAALPALQARQAL